MQAVFEVAYSKRKQTALPGPDEVLNERAVAVMSQFSSQLSNLMLRFSALAQSVEAAVKKHTKLGMLFAFSCLKNHKTQQQREQYYTK